MMKFGTFAFLGLVVAGAVACGATSGDDGNVAHVRQADSTCSHGLCAAGGALTATCDPCAALLCSQDPYCCSSAWDTTCVGEVLSICHQSCTAPPPVDAGPTTCSHGICATGAALVVSCDPCVTTLCAQDPYCCGSLWDATCVNEVTSICGQTCK